MATNASSNNNGNEWRDLLGSTNNWIGSELHVRKDQRGSGECCELCGEVLDQGKPFVTNSAGQRPMHISCSEREEPEAVRMLPARKRWTRLLLSFVSG